MSKNSAKEKRVLSTPQKAKSGERIEPKGREEGLKKRSESPKEEGPVRTCPSPLSTHSQSHSGTG